MKRDKEEFKAKNREESFIKDKRPDIQLGRHTENPQERQQVSQSKKNRSIRRGRNTRNLLP